VLCPKLGDALTLLLLNVISIAEESQEGVKLFGIHQIFMCAVNLLGGNINAIKRNPESVLGIGGL
jgi:hypothetical protein